MATSNRQQRSIGIVGAGIGGVFLAALLEQHFNVSLYEKTDGPDEAGYGIHVA